jgi:hypothetical protein
MPGRKIKDESDARRCLGAVSESEKSQRDWAHANGVDARSLHAWRLILQRKRRAGRQQRGELPRMVELVPTPTPVSSSPICVRCGRFAVDVPLDFDEDTLGRLLTVVGRC